MKKLDLLSNYSKKKVKRYVGKGIRTINHRIIASERGEIFFDGDRNFGYGGLKYDGRWKNVAERVIKKFKLKNNSKVLQIASEKGFLLHEIKKINPKIKVLGVENSNYAINKTIKTVKKFIKKVENFSEIKNINTKFDCVIALGAIYIHTLNDAIKLLKNVERFQVCHCTIESKIFATIRCFFVEFSAISIFEITFIPCKLNHSTLHT